MLRNRCEEKQDQAWQLTPVIPAIKEAEAGESLKPRKQRLQGAKVAPLHSSLGDSARLHLKKKIKEKWTQLTFLCSGGWLEEQEGGTRAARGPVPPPVPTSSLLATGTAPAAANRDGRDAFLIPQHGWSPELTFPDSSRSIFRTLSSHKG